MSDELAYFERRLPVYLVVDTSGSMAGEPIAALEMGLKMLLSDLSCDPQALDTVWLSLITFDSTAEQIVPLSDMTVFQTPHLEAGGTTSLGDAIDLLMNRIEDEVRLVKDDQKGDWRPMVFLFTDGTPTDDWEEPIEEFRRRDMAMVVACAAGPEADDGVLQKLSPTVLRLQDTQPGTLGAFMKWVTLSLTETSKSLGTRADRSEMLPELPPDQGIQMVH